MASTKIQPFEQDRLQEDPPQVAEPIASSPSRDEIAGLAYSYWLLRGCTDGGDVNDWLRAEAELRNKGSNRNT